MGGATPDQPSTWLNPAPPARASIIPICHTFSKYAKSASPPPESCTISQLNKYTREAYNAPIIKLHEGGPCYEE